MNESNEARQSIEKIISCLEDVVLASEDNLEECKRINGEPCELCTNMYLIAHGTYYLLTPQADVGDDFYYDRIEGFTQVVAGLVKTYSEEEDKLLLKELKKKAKDLNLLNPSPEED